MKIQNFFFLLITLSAHAAKTESDGIKVLEGIELSRVPLSESLASIASRSEVTDLFSPNQKTVVFVENKKIGIAVPKTTATAHGQIPMPNQTTRIYLSKTPGSISYSLYAYGTPIGKDGLYVYQGNGSFSRILETPQPITAAAVHGNRIFFAMDNAIYTVLPGQKIHSVFASDLIRGIQSIALDSDSDLLYLSNSQQIIAVRSGLADVIAQGIGGMLEVQNGDLFVRKPKEKEQVRFKGLKALLQKTQSKK